MRLKVVWTIIVHLAIFRIGVHGQEYVRSLEQLTFEETVDYYPDWSADGKHILYAARGQTSFLYMVPSCGGEPERLTTTPSGHPRWSPDGRYITFDDYDTGNIQMMSASLGTQRITLPEMIPSQRTRHSSWSPDNKILAYYADGDICTVNLSTGDNRRIYHNSGFSARPFCWSADGLGLLIDVRNNTNSDSQIWHVSSDGKTMKQIADTIGSESTPDLSPDGSMVIFTSTASGNQDIWIMSIDNGIKIQLTMDTARDMTPRMSPDGRKIAFSSERGGNRNIWIMELDVSAIEGKLEINKTRESQ